MPEQLVIEIADRHAQGSSRRRGSGCSSAAASTFSARSGRSASFTGTFIVRPPRTIWSVATVPGLRPAMICGSSFSVT